MGKKNGYIKIHLVTVKTSSRNCTSPAAFVSAFFGYTVVAASCGEVQVGTGRPVRSGGGMNAATHLECNLMKHLWTKLRTDLSL